MDPNEFRDIVEADIDNAASKKEYLFLRAPENVQRWHDELACIKSEIETDLIEKKAEFHQAHNECREMDRDEGQRRYYKLKADHEIWRASTTSYKAIVEKRLLESKRILESIKPKQRDLWDLLRWAADLIARDGEGRDWHQAAKDAGLRGADY